MLPEEDIREQLRVVRSLLVQTQTGKVNWEPTGELGTFKSARSRALVLLDRVGRPPHVRLRFSPPGGDVYDPVIQQVLPEAEQFIEEQDLDALLALLYQIVSAKASRSESFADAFLEDE
jgi:hypothetical protein